MQRATILVTILVGVGFGLAGVPARAGSKGKRKPPPPLAKLVKKRILLAKKIRFASGQVQPTSTSLPTLRAVAGLLRKRYTLRVRIEVHTDSRGSARWNQHQSQIKADQLKQILVRMGVKTKRLRAVGRGEVYPIATNRTPAGRAKNSRVELHVIPRHRWRTRP